MCLQPKVGSGGPYGQARIAQPPAETRGFRRATVAGPIPLTLSRSSGVRNPPRLSRRARIRWAMVGPTPGSLSSSWRLARFRSTTESVSDGPPRPRCRGPARGRARPRDAPRHFRCGAIRASVAGPIPGTARRSSTPENAPLSSRRRTILFAVAGPTPGRRSSSSSGAVLGSSLSSGDKGRLRRASSLLRSLLSARSLPVSEVAASYGVGPLGVCGDVADWGHDGLGRGVADESGWLGGRREGRAGVPRSFHRRDGVGHGALRRPGGCAAA